MHTDRTISNTELLCKRIWSVGIKIERLKRSRTYYATFRGQVVQGSPNGSIKSPNVYVSNKVGLYNGRPGGRGPFLGRRNEQLAAQLGRLDPVLFLLLLLFGYLSVIKTTSGGPRVSHFILFYFILFYLPFLKIKKKPFR
jgi:hypothetical protein